MNFDEFYKDILEKATYLDIAIESEKVKLLYQYMMSLIEWNEKINLTAITEPKEIILKHYIDSFTINQYIGNDKKVMDLGTGAGFPGIPLKVINDSNKITLVDSLNKRIIFLKEIIDKLDLKNIEAIHGRAEELGRDEKYREQYDVVVSRAVAPMNILLEYMIPMLKVNGICICMKGNNATEEIEKAENALKQLDGEIIKIDEFYLPQSDIKRSIIIVRKILKTNNKFPRKPGIPGKDPI